MGRKGWGGAAPADDAEARKRIVDAAVHRIERCGPRHTSLSDIANDLGITRPTIYRYFASTEDLLAAAMEVALDGWTARIGDMTKDMDDAVDLLTEAVAFLIERLPDEPLLALLLETDRMRLVGRQMVMPTAIARSRIMLENTRIDWDALGFHGTRLDDLVEFLLRLIQSMVIAPSDPPRTAAALRVFLRQWIGPAIGPANGPESITARTARVKKRR
jgi:AcrR family transcriptional regulator